MLPIIIGCPYGILRWFLAHHLIVMFSFSSHDQFLIFNTLTCSAEVPLWVLFLFYFLYIFKGSDKFLVSKLVYWACRKEKSWNLWLFHVLLLYLDYSSVLSYVVLIVAFGSCSSVSLEFSLIFSLTTFYSELNITGVVCGAFVENYVIIFRESWNCLLYI